MTLQEFVRDSSREAEDAIRLVDKKLAEYLSSKAAASLRIKQARGAAEANRAIGDERRHNVEELSARLRDIERKIAELQLRRDEQKRLVAEAHSKFVDAQNSVSKSRKAEEQEQQGLRHLEDQVKEAELERNRHKDRLTEAKSSALTAYLNAWWKRMLELTASQEDKKRGHEARRALEEARHRDARVGGLWEAREEWRRILSGPLSVLVRTTAQEALKRSEAELEKLFPGALDAALEESSNDEIAELYYKPNSADGALRLFLPVAESAWKSMAAGGHGVESALASQLFWQFAKSLPVKMDNSEYLVEDGRCLLRTGLGEQAIGEVGTVRVSLGLGGSVAFILSPLPSEILEAMGDEDSD